MCVERRMHGSVGGVGPSSREAVRAYPTETRASAARGARRVKPDPALRRGRASQAPTLSFSLCRIRDRPIHGPGRIAVTQSANQGIEPRPSRSCCSPISLVGTTRPADR